MMYSLTFPLPLNFIEISLLRRVLVSALSFFAKRFSISARKSLALVIPSDTVLLKASVMSRLMVIRLRLPISQSLFFDQKYLQLLENGAAQSLVPGLDPCDQEQ